MVIIGPYLRTAHLKCVICGLEGAQIATQRKVIVILLWIRLHNQFHALLEILEVLLVNWRQLLGRHIVKHESLPDRNADWDSVLESRGLESECADTM